MSALRGSAADKAAHQRRNRELARIHILKAELKLDRDQYEAVLWTIGRKESSADLDEHGRRAVIAHLESHVPSAKRFHARPHNTDTKDRAELKKIEALLADANLQWGYAEGMARHMYKRDRLEFCNSFQLAGILTALEKKALKRLSKQLEELFGESAWRHHATFHAAYLFGFPLSRDIEKYTEPMSQVLRWWRGDLQAVCEWPVNLDKPKCCDFCFKRTARE